MEAAPLSSKGGEEHAPKTFKAFLSILSKGTLPDSTTAKLSWAACLDCPASTSQLSSPQGPPQAAMAFRSNAMVSELLRQKALCRSVFGRLGRHVHVS